MKIIVEKLRKISVEKQRIEIVERKGLGHPDTMCDSIMENVSLNLCKEYMKKFGTILHYNVDKGMLVAGGSEKKFGGGKIVVPIRLIFGDRATYKVGEKEIDVKKIAITSAKEWIKKNLRFVDPEKHVVYQVEIKPGSAELTDIFARKGKVLGANDTSAAVGYAPLSETEKIVLSTEKFLNSKNFKKEFPDGGEDVKIMGYRENTDLHLTFAMPLIDRFISSEEEYFRKKKEILERTRKFIEEKINKEKIKKLYLYYNTLDRKGRGMGGMYLTVTGTSAEDADCGQVGRGNRVNGLIALNRPTGTEAAAGKNPLSHVGKIYNVLTYKIANEIHSAIGAKEVYVWLGSQIGVPINKPMTVTVQLIGEEPTKKTEEQIKEITNRELENIDKLTRELAEGKYAVC